MPSLPFQIDFPTDWIIEAEAWQWAAVIGMAGPLPLACMDGMRNCQASSTGQGLPGWGRWAMGLMRFCALGIIGFLLLEPLIQSVDTTKKNPSPSCSSTRALPSWHARMPQPPTPSTPGPTPWSKILSQRGLEVERYGFAGELRPIIEVDSAFQLGRRTDQPECGHPHARPAHRKPQHGRHRSGIRWAHQPRCLTCLRRSMAQPPGVDRWIGRHHRRS